MRKKLSSLLNAGGSVKIPQASAERELHLVLKSLIVGVVFTGVTLLLGTHWETNDDPSIAYLLSLKNNDYSPFQWRFLSIIIHMLLINVPVINWWAVNCVLAVGLAAVAFSYVIYRRLPHQQADSIVIIILVVLWISAGYRVNFTRSAAVLAMGGCLLAADSILHHQRVRLTEFIIGCFLFLHGASIRSNSALIALAFLAVIGGTWLLSDGFKLKLAWVYAHTIQIVGLCLVAVLFFGASFFDYLLLTPEQREYVDYNSIRSEIQDYTGSYPYYSEAPEEYQAAGVDEMVKGLLFDWFSEDTELVTKDLMKAVVQLKNSKGSLLELRVKYSECIVLIHIAFSLCVLLVLRRKWNFLRILPPTLFAIAVSALLSLGGRLPLRVYEPIIALMSISVVFLAADQGGNCDCASELAKNTKKYQSVLSCVLAVVYFLGIFFNVSYAMRYAEDAYEMAEYPWDSNEDMDEFRSITLDTIDADKDNIYIYDLYAYPFSLSYAYTMWEARDTGYCENLFFLGGWDARHPYNVKRLENHGISNPVRALFENPRVRTVYSQRVIDYLRVKYDPRMTTSELGLFGYTLIVQYCAPIDDAMVQPSKTGVANVKEVRQCTGEYWHAWYFEAQANTAGDDVRDFYCNITLNQNRYTYRLFHDNGKLSAYFYDIGDGFDWKKADVTIFELTEDGQYVEYKIQ